MFSKRQEQQGKDLHYWGRWRGQTWGETTTYRDHWCLIGSPVTRETRGWGQGNHIVGYWLSPIIKAFQIGKGVPQACILSPCVFNLYAVYIMRNTGLDEAQAGIKIARRNINNLRYAYVTTLTAESEKKLKKELLEESERREWKSWLKTQYSKN